MRGQAQDCVRPLFFVSSILCTEIFFLCTGDFILRTQDFILWPEEKFLWPEDFEMAFFCKVLSSSFVLTQKKNETRRKSQGCVCEAAAERPDRRAKRNSLRSDSVSPLPPDSSLRLTPLRRGRSFYAKALRCLREVAWRAEHCDSPARGIFSPYGGFFSLYRG